MPKDEQSIEDRAEREMMLLEDDKRLCVSVTVSLKMTWWWCVLSLHLLFFKVIKQIIRLIESI